MRRPIQSTDRLLEPTPMSFRLSNTPSTSRSVRSLRTEASAGTRVGSTSARRSATSSSGSNPSVPICGKSISVLLPSGGLTKNSSSFSTPTATQDVTQSVKLRHQLAPLCQPSGALFTARALHWRDRRPRLPSGRSTDPVDARGLGCGVRTGWTQRLAVPRSQANRRPQSGGGRSLKIGGDELQRGWPPPSSTRSPSPTGPDCAPRTASSACTPRSSVGSGAPAPSPTEPARSASSLRLL